MVVNDGSSDQTEPRARAAGAKVLSHPFNMGYGVTLQTGYKYALKYGFEYVLQMDGDGQHDPRYLPILLQEVREGRADVVIGSRFLGEGDYQAAWTRQGGDLSFPVCGQLFVRPEDHRPHLRLPGLEPPGRRILRPGFFPGRLSGCGCPGNDAPGGLAHPGSSRPYAPECPGTVHAQRPKASLLHLQDVSVHHFKFGA